MTAGIFRSESDAVDFSLKLGLNPEVIPYDKARDEEVRVQHIQSILSGYADSPNPRDRIAEENPELYEFLQKFPAYWNTLPEESDVEN